jgi:hypothetical protein
MNQERNSAYFSLKKDPTLIRQMHHEINWLENKILEVEEQMKKRSSKIKHLNDLKRQIKEKKDWLNS